MRHKRIIIGVLAATALTSAPGTASAQPSEQPAQLRLSAEQFWRSPGSGIEVFVDHCLGGPDGPVTSPGFANDIHLSESGGNTHHGSGTLASKTGTYTATLRCKGNSTPAEVTFTIENPYENHWGVRPTEIEPGGTVTVHKGMMARGCSEHVFSPGFVAPIKVPTANQMGGSGTGAVITTPGTYEVTLGCGGKDYVKSFKILGDPPTTPSPKPQVPVKPKGAPETGDGSTA